MLFLPSVENLDKKQQQLFLDHYYDLLLKLKWFLLAERSKNPDFQSLHDKLFQKTFQIKSNAPLKITRIFEKFLKGITYFESQHPTKTHPIYHRLASCGNWSSQLGCVDPQNKKERSIASERIERCYIERLIFDDMFRHETLFFPENPSDVKKQDDGHEAWMQKTEKEFTSCFPNIRIEVKLGKFDSSYPTTCEIKRFVKGKLASIETYEKNFIHTDLDYDPFTYCKLKSLKNDITKVKISSFRKQTKWNKLI